MQFAEVEPFVSETLRRWNFHGWISVYVHGSVASGRAHSESDLDLGVLLDRRRYPTERDRFEQRLLLISSLSRIEGPEADVIILNDAPATLGRKIVTQGKRILCTDPQADHEFVRDVQLEAADLDLFLRRMRAIKLEALARR